MNITPNPTAAGEPETLGPADVAHLADKPKAKPKPAPFLDPCVSYLAAGPMSPKRLLAQAFKQEDASQVQVDSLLREVGRDSRFQVATLDGEQVVALADMTPAMAESSGAIADRIADQAKPAEPEAPAAQEPAEAVAQSEAPAAEVGQPAGEPEVKTLGEHMAEAEASAAAKSGPDGVIPTAVSQPISTVIARPMTPEEAAAQHLANLEAHHARGKTLSLRFFELKADQAEKQADLNEVHKELKKHSELMAEHMRAEPRADGQTTIPFNQQANDDGDAEGGEAVLEESVQQLPEKWAYAVAPDQVLAGDTVGLDLLRLRALLRHDLPPADKPHQLGASGIVEVKASKYVVRDHSEKGDRWFLQPLFTKDEWQQLHEAAYGRAVEDFDQNDEAKATRTAGGADCGRVVKVGAKKFVLGPESHGLVVTIDITPEPEVNLKAKDAAEPDAKERAAGETNENPHLPEGYEEQLRGSHPPGGERSGPNGERSPGNGERQAPSGEHPAAPPAEASTAT